MTTETLKSLGPCVAVEAPDGTVLGVFASEASALEYVPELEERTGLHRVQFRFKTYQLKTPEVG